MTVKDLIEKLESLPQDAEVWYLWDGALRTRAYHAYETKSGVVAIAGQVEEAYSDVDRPLDAPHPKDDPYWSTPQVVFNDD